MKANGRTINFVQILNFIIGKWAQVFLKYKIQEKTEYVVHL